MASYTTWAKVKDLYPLAEDVEPTGADQTALITAYSNLFHSFIRHIHKEDLTSPYDEAVTQAVALLIVDELRRRAQTDDAERAVEVNYPHWTGVTTTEGAGAHALIHSIRTGAIVLTQDKAEHDLHYPEVAPDSGNTGTGTVQAHLPHEYKSDREDTYLVEIETDGRVDDESATFKFYMNNNATPIGSGKACSAAWIQLRNELYIRFIDAALTGDSFKDGDKFTVVGVPPNAEAQTSGPQQLEVYLG